MSNIAVVTTFPNDSWNVYAKSMLESFVKNWPEDVPIMVQLDNSDLKNEVSKILRPEDGLACGWKQDHVDFVNRNRQFDEPNNYRKQVTRFCHKVFAIYDAYQALKQAREAGAEVPRYFIWMDADVITSNPVSLEDLKKCLPKDGDSVSYLGRKEWPHSECGWLAFDFENEGGMFIDVWHGMYVSDAILKLSETHDSWVFDHIRMSKDAPKCTNLTEDKPGMDIWPYSPMGAWSTHYKGPVAKDNLVPKQQRSSNPNSNVNIVTKNSIPDSEIQDHVRENQRLIKNWVSECTRTNEQIVVVSAGPQLMAEDVLNDYNSGRKIIAVKHALKPLKEAGIKPWACILLDPRPHVANFVDDPDTDVIWFVASQVNPEVTEKLLDAGCTVWGYHASVGAGEHTLTSKQPGAVIGGGSATATRGLFLLKHLGFHRIKLYGYDLCVPDKPDLNATDEHGQPKYLEMSVGWNNPLSNLKKCFWTEPQLIAQFEEMNDIIQKDIFELQAHGDGIIAFVLKGKRRGEFRASQLRSKMPKPLSYRKLLKCSHNSQFNRKLKKMMMRLTMQRSI